MLSLNQLNDEVNKEEDCVDDPSEDGTRIVWSDCKEPAHNLKMSGSALETISGYRNYSDNRANDRMTEKTDHGRRIHNDKPSMPTIPIWSQDA